MAALATRLVRVQVRLCRSSIGKRCSSPFELLPNAKNIIQFQSLLFFVNSGRNPSIRSYSSSPRSFSSACHKELSWLLKAPYSTWTHRTTSIIQKPVLRPAEAAAIQKMQTKLETALNEKKPVLSHEFNYLIELLSRNGRLADAMRVVEQMRKHGVKLNEKLLIHLVMHYGRFGRFGEAMEWFTQLKALSPVPSSLAYAAIIEACARNGRSEEITHFYDEMRSRSIPGQVDTYRWMLHAYGAAKRMSDAVELWQHMKAENTPLNLVLYNSMLDVCAKNARPEYASAYWQEMQENRIAPDAFSYTSYITALGSGLPIHFNKVVPIFEEMKKKYQPNGITYAVLINVLRNRFFLTHLVQYFEEARANLTKPYDRHIVYSQAIMNVLRTTRRNQAFAWYLDMTKEKLLLKPHNMARLIKDLEHMPEVALRVFADAQAADTMYRTSKEILEAAVATLVKANRLHDAKQIVAQAVAAGTTSTAQTNALLTTPTTATATASPAQPAAHLSSSAPTTEPNE